MPAMMTSSSRRAEGPTYMAQITNVKDVQAHLRHSNARTTLDHYIKSVPESVRALSKRLIIC